jgi:hypothetical protein
MRHWGAKFVLLAFIVTTLGNPLPGNAQSSCAGEYGEATQLLKALVEYHQAAAASRNDLWKRATTLSMKASWVAGRCDFATLRRHDIAEDVYWALSISNGSIPASKENLDGQLSLLIDDSAETLPNYAPSLSYTADVGFDEVFMRWLVQRLVSLYHLNHYAMDDLRPEVLSGVKYWLPNFAIP